MAIPEPTRRRRVEPATAQVRPEPPMVIDPAKRYTATMGRPGAW